MIGTLRETELHAQLKRYYARPIDQLEAAVDGYVVDVLRDSAIVEIQTHNFTALKPKLPRLLANHLVTLVHPVAVAKWIVTLDARCRPVRRRKSPRGGRLEDVFLELVSCPELMINPNLTLEVILIHEEEHRLPARRRWRDWRVCNRRLLAVIDRVVFSTPDDFRRFIPRELPQPFTSGELAAALDRPLMLAQKITYCLRRMGVIEPVGRRRRAVLYQEKYPVHYPGAIHD